MPGDEKGWQAAKDLLTIVMPAYNEAEALPQILPGILSECARRDWRLIVVNDGSKDATGEVLRTFEGHTALKVVKHKLNRGYGGALKSGLAQAETEYVVTMDADGQHRLEDAAALLDMIIATDADMVVGNRQAAHRRNAYREAGKWLIRRLTTLMLPLPIRDLNSGFKMYKTRLVQKYLPLCPDSMAFSDVITLLFINQRCLVLEHPIQVGQRLGGKSTINLRTALETMVGILHLTILLNPMRVFGWLATLFIAAGLLWGIPIVLLGRGVSVGAMLAIVSGIICFFFGLIAEQLSLIRKQIAGILDDHKK